MASQITNYKCPACTGPLHFSAESGKLECEYCGSSFNPAQIEKIYAEKDRKAAQAMADEKAKEQEKQEKERERNVAEAREEGQMGGGIGGKTENPEAETKANNGNDSAAEHAEGEQTSGNWNYEGATSDWGEDAKKMKAYTCPSCGAELVCSEETAATSCPYCGNPTIIPGQFDGTLRPDYIIPFKVKKEAAVEALKKHYKKKIFLPGRFKEENHIQEIQGVYVPFWLYDGETSGSGTYEATISRTHRERDFEVTRTQHFHVKRSGEMDFEKVPADASTRMPDAHMDSIEPFDYRGLKPFSMSYLPGFLADKYDVSVEACSGRAVNRCKQTMETALYRTVTGYTTVCPVNVTTSVRQGKVHYAMLPVWMLSTKWKGKNFLFAMNGQTGKLVGDLPISWGKFWGTFAAIAVPVAGIAALVQFFI